MFKTQICVTRPQCVNRTIRCNSVGRNSSVGVATRYGLGGPGIESRWGRVFPHLSRLALGPTQAPVQWVPGFPGVKEWPGRNADPSPASSAVGHERVELYLYCPYGPYSLYRASVPVQGCILHLPYVYIHTYNSKISTQNGEHCCPTHNRTETQLTVLQEERLYRLPTGVTRKSVTELFGW